MIDNYSKIVLTVIAIALCLNVWANIKPVHQAHAQAQMRSCTKDSPCWMALYGYDSWFRSNPLPVRNY
jgi:hypothetical protein